MVKLSTKDRIIKEDMEKEQLEQILGEAFGEISALFMSQGDTKAGQIIMPTGDLSRILEDTIKKIGL